MARTMSEVEAEALAELVEVAVMLKKSGILGWLKAIAENGDKLIELVTSDYTLFRQLALLQALGGGLGKLDVGEFVDARMNAEKTIYCAFKGLSQTDPAKAPRVGMLGALRMLGDKDVQKGLGLLLALAKNMGSCLNEMEKRGKQG